MLRTIINYEIIYHCFKKNGSEGFGLILIILFQLLKGKNRKINLHKNYEKFYENEHINETIIIIININNQSLIKKHENAINS